MPNGRNSLPFAAQQYALVTLYPTSQCVTRRDRLVWRGELQPTPLSRLYRVCIEYEMRQVPNVFVVEPLLRKIADAGFSKDRKLPHVYPEQGDPLCLYNGLREWNSARLIARSIVPWTCLWLQFFEVWVNTNTWEGSGAPYGQESKAAA